MNKVKKSLVALGLSSGLVAGGAAGAILGAPGVSGAQEDTTTTAPVDSSQSDSGQSDSEAKADVSSHFSEALAPLVSNGTITQAQADAVIQALADAGPPAGGRGGPHGRGPALDSAAEALGITEDELHTALHDGQTIAEVAESKGVDVQTVIDAMVADVKAHLDEEVTEGDLTQAEADERLAAATERITDMVNNGRPERHAEGD